MSAYEACVVLAVCEVYSVTPHHLLNGEGAAQAKKGAKKAADAAVETAKDPEVSYETPVDSLRCPRSQQRSLTSAQVCCVQVQSFAEKAVDEAKAAGEALVEKAGDAATAVMETVQV